MSNNTTQEEKKSSEKRSRNWTFVLYPESAPEDWREILDTEHIKWVESPLHDKDLNPDGTTKKAHWHILLLFNGKKSFSQIQEITKKLNAPIPQVAADAKALVRYMAHLDHPDKVQYERSAIIGHGGADVALYLKATSSTRYELISEMIEYIRENEIVEFIDFMGICMAEHRDDWFPLVCDSSAFIIDMVIKSNRHKPRKSPSSLAQEAINPGKIGVDSTGV
jgi:hypothetical protein